MIIFMWSGPRNLSTALMRSFENRNDTKVVVEPFYSYYLKENFHTLLRISNVTQCSLTYTSIFFFELYYTFF